MRQKDSVKDNQKKVANQHYKNIGDMRANLAMIATCHGVEEKVLWLTP